MGSDPVTKRQRLYYRVFSSGRYILESNGSTECSHSLCRKSCWNLQGVALGHHLHILPAWFSRLFCLGCWWFFGSVQLMPSIFCLSSVSCQLSTWEIPHWCSASFSYVYVGVSLLSYYSCLPACTNGWIISVKHAALSSICFVFGFCTGTVHDFNLSVQCSTHVHTRRQYFSHASRNFHLGHSRVLIPVHGGPRVYSHFLFNIGSHL